MLFKIIYKPQIVDSFVNINQDKLLEMHIHKIQTNDSENV